MFYFNILKYIIKHRKNLYYNSRNSCRYNESPMYQNYYDSIRTDSDDTLILKMFYDVPMSQYGNQVHNKMYIIEKDEVEGILLGFNISLYYIAKFFTQIDNIKRDIADYFQAKRDLKKALKKISESVRESE